MRAGELRHVCDVMRPATTKGTRGQEVGKDQILVRNWPCSITSFGGSETEQAGSTFADASFEVSGYGSPGTPFRAKDYLIVKDSSGRRLDISHVNDILGNGSELVLSCGEQVGEKVA